MRWMGCRNELRAFGGSFASLRAFFLILKVSKKYAEQGVEQDNVGGEHDPVDQFLCTGIEVIIIPFEKGFQYKTGLGCAPVHKSIK